MGMLTVLRIVILAILFMVTILEVVTLLGMVAILDSDYARDDCFPWEGFYKRDSDCPCDVDHHRGPSLRQ